MEISFAECMANPERYVVPDYDQFLFETMELDVWCPSDYPIVNLGTQDVFYLVSFLLQRSPRDKMFRYSKTISVQKNEWRPITRPSLFLEKFICDRDTTFEIKFGDDLLFRLQTTDKEFDFGCLPLSSLGFTAVSVKFDKTVNVKTVLNDVVDHNHVPATFEYLDRRMFRLGNDVLLGMSGMVGYDFDKEDPRIKPKPVLVEPVKMARHLVMLFFIEFRLDPEFIAGKSGLWS